MVVAFGAAFNQNTAQSQLMDAVFSDDNGGIVTWLEPVAPACN
jgi:hypothetical protein